MIQVRISRLASPARRILMAGSVLSDTFRCGQVSALLGHALPDSVVAQHMAELENEEILATRLYHDPLAEPVYQFRHALIRDAAYKLLTIEEKVNLHQAAALVLEKTAGSHLHYQSAIDYLAKLPMALEQRRQRVVLMFEQTRAARGKESPMVSIQRLHEAEESLTQIMTEPGDQGPNQKLLQYIQVWLGQMYFLSNQLPHAIRFFEGVLKQKSDDPALVLLPTATLGRSFAVQGHFTRAVECLEQLLPVFDSAKGEHDVISGVAFLCLSLIAAGDCARGLEIAERAVQVAEATGNQTIITATRGPRIVCFLFAGDDRRAIEESQLAAHAAEESGSALFLYLVLGFRAWAQSRVGRHAEARQEMALCQAIARRFGSRLLVGDWFDAINAELAYNRGDFTAARSLGEAVLAGAPEGFGLFAAGLANRIIALALMQDGQWEAAAGRFVGSIERFEAGKAVLEAARTRRSWAEALRQRGREAEAAVHDQQARQTFSQAGIER